MMQPMSDYFYGDAEAKDQEHLNLHSIALDDAEASFPAPEEVRSTTTSRNRFPVSYKPKAKTRYFWIASIVALLMVVIMVPAIVVRGGKKDSAIVPAKVADPPPRPRPSLESVVDYFEKEGISEASLLKDVNSPQFKAAQWLANEDTANIVVPPHETKHMDGYFYTFRYVMALTWFATGGENWFLQHKFMSEENVCRWNTGNFGVLCYEFEGMVTPVEVILSSNNLEGSIPAELSKLFTLRGLNLGVGLLSGPINTELCALRDLRYLVLNHNALSGPIPSCLSEMKDLEELILSDNALTGSLPTELGTLTQLTNMYIDDNQLAGDPTPVFNALTKLTHLLANKNEFVSVIDNAFLGQNKALTWLDLSFNNFTSIATFPAHLINPNTQVLDLSKNRLSFALPTNMVENNALWFLALHDNKITGALDCLSSLKGLVHLDVSSNALTGSLQPIGSLSVLEVLFLSENPGFSYEPVPTSFANLTNLVELSLRNTKRDGTLPKLPPKIQLLDLSHNFIIDTFPEDYGKLTNLTVLLLNGNGGIQGELPPSFKELVELRAVFLDGTALENAMDFMCMLQDVRALDREEVLVADCDDCDCKGCKCCTPGVKGGCSQPSLDNLDVSWESDFKRQKYALLDYTKDAGLGQKPHGTR